MITVNKAINLEQLDKEINGLGLIGAVDEDLNIIAVGLAENNTATIAQLESAIDNHVAVFTELTIDDKLASLGLTIDDLKAALGV